MSTLADSTGLSAFRSARTRSEMPAVRDRVIHMAGDVPTTRPRSRPSGSSNGAALRATVENCLSHSSTICCRETPFQVDAVLDQSGNIRGDFPRAVWNEAQVQDARGRRRPKTENQLSVIPVEGYDYPVLRAGDPNDVFVGDSGRPLADRNHIVPTAPQTSHAIQRYVLIRERLQPVVSPLTS